MKGEESNFNLSGHKKFGSVTRNLNRWEKTFFFGCNWKPRKLVTGRADVASRPKLDETHFVQCTFVFHLIYITHTQQVFQVQKMWPQGSHTNTYRLLLESIFECQRWSFNFLRPLPQLHKGVGFQRKSFTRRLDLCSFGGPDKLLGSKSSHVCRLVWVTGKKHDYSGSCWNVECQNELARRWYHI